MFSCESGEGLRKFRFPKRFMAIPSPIVAVEWWRVSDDEDNVNADNDDDDDAAAADDDDGGGGGDGDDDADDDGDGDGNDDDSQLFSDLFGRSSDGRVYNYKGVDLLITICRRIY